MGPQLQEVLRLADGERCVDAEDNVEAKQDQKELKQKMYEPLVHSILCWGYN